MFCPSHSPWFNHYSFMRTVVHILLIL
jgi:hypothetical protein